jgi:hypothetical protein
MSDSEKEGWIPYDNSGKRGILRFASYVLPALVTIISLLICWRRHFDRNSIAGAGVGIAGSFYCAVALYRRSRGLSARIFSAYTGPDRDSSHQDQSDIGALWGAAIFIGFMVFMLIKYW